MVSNPKATPQSQQCKLWLNSLEANGNTAVIPEIADYELRRELLRAGKINGIIQLDRLKAVILYLPITTEVMLKAAELWANARKAGYPTASPDALDGDVILAAQALLLQNEGDEVIIATTNVGHLSRFIDAREWQDI
ncbi:hypothetical protein RIVM261_038120 [Rivularia sp. IAM M-261]|nr:hypothetical protein RIVM261_038120 [Rivularia sp. IAM M-261]